jgi:hypothetical protein
MLGRRCDSPPDICAPRQAAPARYRGDRRRQAEEWLHRRQAARDAFLAALNRTASQKRIKALMERGFHRPGDVENRLGFYVGQIGD